jgi:hypothetical protein
MVGLAALLVGATLGGFLAEVVGIPDWVGVVVGAVGGYFLSQWILRRWFADRA